jgi:excisionase family DNA binding protein
VSDDFALELPHALADALRPVVEMLVDERLERRLAEIERAQSRRTWITLAEAADRLGCTYDAIRMRADRGTIESRRQGGRRYVLASAIEQLDGSHLR